MSTYGLLPTYGSLSKFILSLWGLTPLIDMMIWFSSSTGSNCFIPVPNRLPIPAAMISNVVFISVVLSCLKTYHMFINSLDSLSSLNGVRPQCLFQHTSASFSDCIFSLLQYLPNCQFPEGHLDNTILVAHPLNLLPCEGISGRIL